MHHNTSKKDQYRTRNKQLKCEKVFELIKKDTENL